MIRFPIAVIAGMSLAATAFASQMSHAPTALSLEAPAAQAERANASPERMATHQCDCSNPIQVAPVTEDACPNYAPFGGDTDWTSNEGGTCSVCYREYVSNCQAGHSAGGSGSGGGSTGGGTGGSISRILHTYYLHNPNPGALFSAYSWTACITEGEKDKILDANPTWTVEDSKQCP